MSCACLPYGPLCEECRRVVGDQDWAGAGCARAGGLCVGKPCPCEEEDTWEWADEADYEAAP